MISENRTKFKLGDLCETISVTHKFDKDQLIFLNTSDILNGNILHRNYSETKRMPGQAKKTICKDDILFSEIRPANGRWTFVDFDADDYVVSTKLMVIRANSRIRPRFLYKYLTSPNIASWLQHLAESRSGTFPQITFQEVAGLEISLPSLSEQDEIEGAISSLDDKTELNRRMNETLEAIARAIYKSWFVDFDPVKAKMEGRKPFGMDEETARLFPGEFEESKMGRIPKGWMIANLGDYVETISITHRFEKDKVIFLNTSDILNGEFLHTNYSNVQGLPGQAKKSIQRGDILFSEIRPANKRFAFVDFDADDYVVSTKLMVLRCKKGIDPIAVYYFLKSEPILTELQVLAESRSGTFPQITFDQVKKLSFITPQESIMEKYATMLKVFYAKIRKNQQENSVLVQTREALLPRLLSGEIKCKGNDN